MGHEELIILATEADARSRSNTHRLDEMKKQLEDQGELISTVAVLASNQDRMERDVKEIKADVKGLAQKPGQRWESLADKTVWAVLAAVISFLLARIGL